MIDSPTDRRRRVFLPSGAGATRATLIAGGCVIAALAGGLATHYGQLIIEAAVVVAVATLCARGRYWPLAALLVWFAAAGTELDSGLVLGGVHLPVSYLLVSGVAVTVLLRASQGRAPRGVRARTARWLVIAGIVPVALLAMQGALGGNDLGVIREEALLWVSCILTAVSSALSLTRSDMRALAWAFVVAGLIAAIKTLALDSVTPTAVDVFSASNTLNPQFGVQRVILIGGDTLVALSLPVGVGLLRDARGVALLVVSAALPVIIVGLVLTYTRTLLGAALVGAVVAWSLPIARRTSRLRSLTAITAVAGTALYLLSFTFGQSQYSAGEALLLRLTGGEQVGASVIGERLVDAAAAIGDSGVLIRGRGLGATFLSPITPADGLTGYVHMGYPQLILQGGLPLTLAVTGLLLWVGLRLATAARNYEDISTRSALAGLVGAVAAFAAINLLVNRFAAVEGMVFLGVVVGAACVVSERRASEEPDFAEAPSTQPYSGARGSG